jgi:large subunit ribosomal protein L21
VCIVASHQIAPIGPAIARQPSIVVWAGDLTPASVGGRWRTYVRQENVMQAVIATGGKQYRVAVGDELEVERLDAADDGTVNLRPVLVVDDDGTVHATPDTLDGAAVTATVIDAVKGPKLTVFMYRNKSGYRRRTGHRQQRSRIRIDAINT